MQPIDTVRAVAKIGGGQCQALSAPSLLRTETEAKMKRRTKSRAITGFRLDGLTPTPLPKRVSKTRRPATRGDWWKMRAAHLRVYPECRICGATDRDNNVHHMVYRGARGATEKPGDLVTLCREHHDEFHAIYGRARDIKGSIVDKTLAFIEAKRRLPL